jgi:gamma-glutamylputrescine oxidase
MSSSRSAVGWDDDPVVAAWTGRPRLDGDRCADACVIGLGASGLAAVRELADRGLSVIGVDAGRVAAGAAGRNGGFLLGGSAWFLHQAIAAWGADSAVALYQATLGELDRLAAELGPDVVRRNGSIRLAGLPPDPCADAPVAPDSADARAVADDWADCQLLARALRTHGIAVQDYEGELGRGLFLPDDGAVNPARRVIESASALLGRAELYEHTAVSGIRPGSPVGPEPVNQVVTGHGVITARFVIVAVDGRLEQLVPQLRGRVRTARLQMLATRPGTVRVLPCPVYGRRGYDYAQTDPRGRLFVGGGRDRLLDDEWTTDARPSAQVQRYIEEVARRMAGSAVTVESRWAASVGYTVDARAVVSEVDAGVVACGGYSGTGNLVGPIAARAAVALALDGERPPAYFSS